MKFRPRTFMLLVLLTAFLSNPFYACAESKSGSTGLPDIELKSAGTGDIRLLDPASKCTAVLSWMADCPDCDRAIAMLVDLAEVFEPKGVRFVALVPGKISKRKLRKALNPLAPTYPVLLDPKGAACDALGFTGAPEFAVLNSEGVVLKRIRELTHESAERLTSALEFILETGGISDLQVISGRGGVGVTWAKRLKGGLSLRTYQRVRRESDFIALLREGGYIDVFDSVGIMRARQLVSPEFDQVRLAFLDSDALPERILFGRRPGAPHSVRVYDGYGYLSWRYIALKRVVDVLSGSLDDDKHADIVVLVDSPSGLYGLDYKGRLKWVSPNGIGMSAGAIGALGNMGKVRIVGATTTGEIWVFDTKGYAVRALPSPGMVRSLFLLDADRDELNEIVCLLEGGSGRDLLIMEEDGSNYKVTIPGERPITVIQPVFWQRGLTPSFACCDDSGFVTLASIEGREIFTIKVPDPVVDLAAADTKATGQEGVVVLTGSAMYLLERTQIEGIGR